MKKFLSAFAMLFTIITQAQENTDVTTYQDDRLDVSDDGVRHSGFVGMNYKIFQ